MQEEKRPTHGPHPIGPPRRVRELTRAERRRALWQTAVRFVVIFVGVITVYYFLPHADTAFRVRDLVVVVLGGAVVVGLAVWEIRSIVRASIPQLRAVEAVAMLIPLFFTSYAAVYSTLSELNPAGFSEPVSYTHLTLPTN